MSGALLSAMVAKTVPLKVTLSVPSANQITSSSVLDFGNNTASVTGGSGSYSYAWTQTNDGAATWAVSPTNVGTTDVKASGISTNGSSAATVTCTVTDNASGRVGHANAAYIASNITINI